MWRKILIELGLFALRRLVKYADNTLNETTVADVEKRLGKTKAK